MSPKRKSEESRLILIGNDSRSLENVFFPQEEKRLHEVSSFSDVFFMVALARLKGHCDHI